MDDLLLLLLLACITTIALRWLLHRSLAPLNQQAIRRLFLQYLVTTGDGVMILAESDHQLSLRIGENTCSIHLEPLYRRCAETPYRSGAIIRQAASALHIALRESTALPDDWRQRVVAVLVRADADPPAATVTRTFLGELLIGYALDAGDFFRWITHHDLEEAHGSEDELHALALRNLERSCSALTIETPPSLPDGTDRLLQFNTEDGLDAARLLIPSFYQRFSPRFGDDNFLVAIPTRDTLLMVSVQDASQVALLNWRAETAYARHAYPLLDKLILMTEQGPRLWQTEGTAVPQEM